MMNVFVKNVQVGVCSDVGDDLKVGYILLDRQAFESAGYSWCSNPGPDEAILRIESQNAGSLCPQGDFHVIAYGCASHGDCCSLLVDVEVVHVLPPMQIILTNTKLHIAFGPKVLETVSFMPGWIAESISAIVRNYGYEITYPMNSMGFPQLAPFSVVNTPEGISVRWHQDFTLVPPDDTNPVTNADLLKLKAYLDRRLSQVEVRIYEN